MTTQSRSGKRPPASSPRRRPRQRDLLAAWLRTPTVVFGLVVIAALLVLGLAVRAYLEDRDWAMVARVGDQDINRAQLRDREAVLAFVAEGQSRVLDTLHAADRIDDAEYASLASILEEVISDPRDEALESLVDASMIRRYISTAGVAVGVVDVRDEVIRARRAAAERRLAWTRIAWQPPTSTAATAVSQPAGTPPDTTQLIQLGEAFRAALAANPTRTDAEEQYRAAGWVVTGGHRWLPDAGTVPGIEPEALAVARTAAIGPVAPVTGTGWVVLAEVTDVATEVDPAVRQQVIADAAEAGVPDGALQDWARERAERRAVATALQASWQGTSGTNVRAEEVVIGPSDPEGAAGPWVELAHLVVADVTESDIPTGPGTAGERLATSLRKLDPARRMSTFRDLTETTASGQTRSGELGFFVKEQLAPGLGEAAFASEVATGSVLGPLPGDFGEELFLVEAQYEGPLDDRAIGALIELRSGAATPLDVAAATAAGESARALGGPWRALPEVADASAAARTLTETPIGELTDPFVLGDQLLAGRILERRTSVPEPDALSRLGVTGFDVWLEAQRRSTPITYAEDGTGVSEPGPASSIPTLLPQGTPRLPVAPPSPESP